MLTHQESKESSTILSKITNKNKKRGQVYMLPWERFNFVPLYFP